MEETKYHVYKIEEAIKYGVAKATLLFNIRFWLRKNVTNKRNKHDGYYWMFNSCAVFHEQFPYYTERSIGRWLNELVEEGVLMTTKEYNKFKWDRTKWYTIPNEFTIEAPVMEDDEDIPVIPQEEQPVCKAPSQTQTKPKRDRSIFTKKRKTRLKEEEELKKAEQETVPVHIKNQEFAVLWDEWIKLESPSLPAMKGMSSRLSSKTISNAKGFLKGMLDKKRSVDNNDKVCAVQLDKGCRKLLGRDLTDKESETILDQGRRLTAFWKNNTKGSEYQPGTSRFIFPKPETLAETYKQWFEERFASWDGFNVYAIKVNTQTWDEFLTNCNKRFASINFKIS